MQVLGGTLAFLLFPLRVLLLVAKAVVQLLMGIWEITSFIISNARIFLLVLVLWYLGFWLFANYGSLVANLEHANRCYVWEAWNSLFKDGVETVRDSYGKAICWTNAISLVNRFLNAGMVIRLLRNCDDDPPFDFFQWVKKIVFLIVDLLADLLRWTFSTDSLDGCFPAYTFFKGLFGDLIPYTGNGVVCLCKDIRILSVWMGRILSDVNLHCLFHQIANYFVGIYQVFANFVLDFLKLLFFVVFGSGNVDDVRDLLLGIMGSDRTLPSLSKKSVNERLNAAVCYLGEYLNVVFRITYCTFISEIENDGDESLSEPSYLTCMSDPSTKPQLFCVICPIFAAMNRFQRLQHTLLWHFPLIVKEIIEQPTGPRYLTEVWFETEFDVALDTIRIPKPLKNYSVSLNFPTLVSGTGISSVLWPNENLYGSNFTNDCGRLNNSRFDVKCDQCATVAEIDLETCACETADFLDRMTAEIIDITVWKPTLCCLVPRILRAYAAFYRYVVGTVVHVLNYDRLGTWLADQNHHEIFFDEVGGEKYAMGGCLVCLREITLGLDNRTRCLADLFAKPLKAASEIGRNVFTAAVRLINNMMVTSEPRFEDFICLTDDNSCIDLESMLFHLRRPRVHLGYSPLLDRWEPSAVLEPAFADCACYWINFEVLQAFYANPPPKLPDFCCMPHYLFRGLLEVVKAVVQFAIAFIETFVTVFDDTRPFTVVVVEWAACSSFQVCNNLDDLASDAEDLLNCPCQLIFEVDDLLGPPKRFFCVCDFLSAVVQTVVNLVRCVFLTVSVIFDLLYCIGNGWPTPHCSSNLWTRIEKAFEYLDVAYEAIAGAVGGLGCFLGIPWVGLGLDCLGTTYTWPLDHPPCSNSPNTFGPNQTPCTMADRLGQVFRYLFKLVVTIFKFISDRVKFILMLGFALTSGGLETTISEAITNFFLAIGEPIFGKSALQLNTDFYTKYESPWPDLTSVNTTALYIALANVQNFTNDSWTYKPPPTYIVYGKTFNYSSLLNVAETTGLVQAIGLSLNCLLGLPTDSCKGPLLFNSSSIRGTDGCLGDLMIVAGNALRDVYSAIISFFGAGLLVLETLFTNPGLLGEAIISFLEAFFVIIYVLVQNAQIILEAIVAVIVEVTRFVLGSGVADLLDFFLTVIADIVSIFIYLIEFLLAPFMMKRSDVSFEGHFTELKRAYETGANSFYFPMPEANISKIASKFLTEVEDHKRFANGTRVRWKRTNMEDFGENQVTSMTDGTFCKSAMAKYHGMNRFDGMNPEQELVWKMCFFAYSLPNEVFAYTNGKLILPPDAFYNPTQILKIVKSGITTWNEYQSSRRQNFMSAGVNGGTYTEIASVPPQIMKYVKSQMEYQSLVNNAILDSASTTSGNRTSDGNSSVHDKRNFDFRLPGLDFLEDAEPCLRRDVSGSETRDVCDKVEFMEALKTKNGIKFTHDIFDSERTGLENGFRAPSKGTFCKPSMENQRYEKGLSYCLDINLLQRGYTLYLPYPSIHASSEDALMEEIIKNHPKRYRKEKRGLIDVATGNSLELNMEYNKATYDDPQSPKFNPFLGTQVTIMSSLGGYAVLNVSKVGYLMPVVDGKVALTHVGMSFLDYMKRKGLNSEQNIQMLKYFENFELTKTKENFLILNSKGAYAEYLLNQEKSKQNLTYRSSSAASNDGSDQNGTNVDGSKRFFEDRSERSKKNSGESKFERPKANPTDPVKNKQKEETKSKTNSKYNPKIFMKWLSEIRNSAFGIKRDGGFANKHRNARPGLRRFFGGILKVIASLGTSAKAGRDQPNVSVFTFVRTTNGTESEERAKRYEGYGNENLNDMKRRAMEDKIAMLNSRYERNVERRNTGFIDTLRDLTVVQIPSLFKHLSQIYFSKPSVDISHRESHEDPSWTVPPKVWKYDGASLKLTETDSEEAFEWEIDEEGRSHVVDPHTTARYDRADLVTVLYGTNGAYRTYKHLALERVEKSENDLDSTRTNDKRSLAKRPSSAMFHLDPGDVLNDLEMHLKDDDERRKRVAEEIPDLVSVKMTFDYHEYHYGTRESAKPCLGHLMWKEQGGKSTVERTVCLRRKGGNPDHPHVKMHGRVLGGKSLYAHRSSMFWNAMNNVSETVMAKLNPDAVLKRIRAVHVLPRLEKIRETFFKRRFLSGLLRPLFVYKNFFRRDKKEWISNPYLDFLLMGNENDGDFRNDDATFLEKKRSHFPSIIDVCFSQNQTSVYSTVQTCTDCKGCSDDDCSYCRYCFNCSNDGSSTSCQECGACRVGPYPSCNGGCFDCSGCLPEGRCTDCALVQEFLAAAYEQVEYCVDTVINDDDGVILRPVYDGTIQYNVVPFDSNQTQPVMGNYGLTGFVDYLNDALLYWISKATGVNVLETIKYYFTTFHLDPFPKKVGIMHTLYFQLPIPFWTRCNRDIHLSCVFGMGLKEALIQSTILVVIVLALSLVGMGFVGTVVAFPSLIAFYMTLVVTLAWNYNLVCLIEPVVSLLRELNIPYFIPPLPVCAMEQTYDLLNGLFNRCSSWIPEGLVADGIVCPDSCKAYVNVTDCSKYGFYSYATVLGYAGQRWIPEPYRFYLVPYLNRTCLVRGSCPLNLSAGMVLGSLLGFILGMTIGSGLGFAIIFAAALALIFGTFGEGLLRPFYEYDFSYLIANDTDLADACFYATSPGILGSLIYLLASIILIYLALIVLRVLLNFFSSLILLPPLSWFKDVFF